MPLLSFLSALLFFPDFITATLCTLIFLHLLSTLLLKFSTLLHAWFLILLNSPIPLHLLSIFTGYLFTFALSLKSVFSCIQFFILLCLPIFLISYYLLNVPAYGPLLILNYSLSLSHSYAKSAFSFSGTLFLLISNHLPIPLFLKT